MPTTSLLKRRRLGDADAARDEVAVGVSRHPSQQPSVVTGVERDELHAIVRNAIAKREEFRRSVRPTLDNLCLYVNIGADADAVDLLRLGARFDNSARSLGVLLELFETNDMPMTISHLVRSRLLPSNVGMEHFIASLHVADNAVLSLYLAGMDSVHESIATLDNETRRHLRYKYSHNMMKWLLQNADEQIFLANLCSAVDCKWLSDRDFIVFVRERKLLRWASDDQLVSVRKDFSSNPYTIVWMMRPLAAWTNAWPSRPAPRLEYSSLSPGSRPGFNVPVNFASLGRT